MFIITCAILTSFSIIGIQLYKGVLRSKCVIIPPTNISHSEYYEFTNNSGELCKLFFKTFLYSLNLENWLKNENGIDIICGNNSLARSHNILNLT